jgi:hypothetical protein
MRKLILLVALIGLVVPVAAMAGTGVPTAGSIANQLCKQQQTSMGTATFKLTYGTNASRSNAFGKCVTKNSANARQDLSNAAKTCKAQQADTGFAAAHGGKTFDQFYGTNNSKGKGADNNAFGKCVSALVKQSVDTQARAATTAAASCKADRKANAAAFATSYGTARNAFGKCVAAKTK